MSAAPSPDCRDGKHRAYVGDSWDVDADHACACSCSCHTEQAGTITGAQVYLEEVDRAWHTAWASISDRSRLNELETV